MAWMRRRKFLAGAGAAAATFWVSRGRGHGAGDEVRVGILGLGGKGRQHSQVFHEIEGVRVVALCDPDSDRQDKAAGWFKKRGDAVEVYADLRRLLDREDIDAVVVATANHWHALAAIWACQAGKDVYVEKPVAWSVWEGQQLVAAARRHGRIVQAGTQQRSEVALRGDLIEFVRSGALGKILWAHGIIWKPREPIPRRATPGEPTEKVDYDLWCGPSPKMALERERLHYDWHWIWRTGNGDMGNLGVHQFDVCRWFCGYRGLPRRVMSLGGRFVWDDAGEAPNTQLAIFDYEGAPIYFSVRTLPSRPGSPVMDQMRGTRDASIVQCENGHVVGGWNGGLVYDAAGKLVRKVTPDGGGTHQANFIEAVRSRKRTDLHADIEEGHVSTAACELANVAHRVGAAAPPGEIEEASRALPHAAEAVGGYIEHVGQHVDLRTRPITLGPWLEVDREAGRIVGTHAEAANALLRRQEDRAPFVVPEMG